MTNNDIITMLKNSKFLSRLKQFNTVLISISGSRSIDIDDEKSDIDVVVIIDDDRYNQINPTNPYEYLVTKDGHKMHWYYHDYDIILNQIDDNKIYNHFFTKFEIMDKNIIEIVDQEKFNKLLNTADSSFLLGSKILYRIFRERILDILSDINNLKETKDKFLYRLYFSEMTLSGEEIDKEFLKRIKLLRYSNETLTDEEVIRCYNLLLSFKNRFEQDYKEEL